MLLGKAKMVEIRYGEGYQIADLAGRSVAKVQEGYESEFNIRERAKAYLNGREVAGDSEPRMVLSDNVVVSNE